MPKLFVYGTLRPPAGGPTEDTANFEHINAHVRSASSASLHGAELLEFIHYPGIRSGADVIVGDLLDVTEEGFEICDEIEGHPDFFHRTEVEVHCARELTIAWVYWAPESMLDQGVRIESGDWFDRDRSRRDGRSLGGALAQDKETY